MHWTHTGTSRVATNKNAPHCCEAFGAENETRTRDPDLGKVVLYHRYLTCDRLRVPPMWSQI